MNGIRIFVMIMIILAVIVGVLGVSLPAHQLGMLARVNSFFTAMLPILAVAALVSYLIKCACCSKN